MRNGLNALWGRPPCPHAWSESPLLQGSDLRAGRAGDTQCGLVSPSRVLSSGTTSSPPRVPSAKVAYLRGWRASGALGLRSVVACGLKQVSAAGPDVRLRHRRDGGVHAPHHHPGAQTQRPHGGTAALGAAPLAAARLQDAGEPLPSTPPWGSRHVPQTPPPLPLDSDHC